MNTNNDVKSRRFIVPKKVEQINDHLLINKSNNIKIGVNDMTVNDNKMRHRECRIENNAKITSRFSRNNSDISQLRCNVFLLILFKWNKCL